MSKRLLALQASLGAIAVLTAMPAAAQTEEQTPSAGGIEEIVVTAQRRAESLQKVPVAVTALSETALVDAGVEDLTDVSKLAPGVQIQPFFKAGDAIYQIRGQVQTDASPTIDPSVGVYFDDVYIARSSGSLTSLLDVSRVEVLKGPQGTLFGKNTTGGAIRILSNAPNFDLGGYVKVGYESFEKHIVEGVWNMPLSETVAARLAAKYSDKRDGYATNIVTGDPIDAMKDFATRGSLLFEPSGGFDIRLQGDYSRTTGGTSPSYLVKYYPENQPAAALEVALESGGFNFMDIASNFVPGFLTLNGLATREGDKPVFGTDLRITTGADKGTSTIFNPFTGEFIYDNAGTPNPQTDLKTWGMMATANLDVGFGNLKSITAYRRTKSFYTYDVDGTQYHLLDAWQINRNKQFSQEFILSGDSLADRLQWNVGALYYTERAFQQDQPKVFSGFEALEGSAGTYNFTTGKNTSYGLFAQGTYDLTDQLSFTAGARYTIDERKADQSAFILFYNAPELCLFSTFPDIEDEENYVPPCTLKSDRTFKDWAYTASLNYQIDPDKLVYARTSRSFRAGGFNSRVTDLAAYSFFEPEYVTDYEVGLKAIWFDRKLRTNLAAYYSKGTDVQTTVSQVSDQNISYNITQNIGKRIVKGVELEATLQPVSWFSIDGGFAYTDGKSKNPAAPDVPFIIKTPKWAANIGANLEFPLSADFDARLYGNVSYRGRLYDSTAPIRYADGDLAGEIVEVTTYRPITLVGGRFSIIDNKSGIELAIYGRNLTNEYYNANQSSFNGLGLLVGWLAEPRVIGGEIKIPFGSGG